MKTRGSSRSEYEPEAPASAFQIGHSNRFTRWRFGLVLVHAIAERFSWQPEAPVSAFPASVLNQQTQNHSLAGASGFHSE
ncbi:MAG: hypothetical protein P4L85_09305, partial [Paludisphaera borealis]|uniref:hypothetical protein n=1 Tax=Paludisphaera borealis TaxID=1387353 RepID=UPI00285092A6